MIYFIQCADRIKVGYSGKPKVRFSKIQADAPFECKLLGIMEGDIQKERELHALFSEYHCRGEWFEAHGAITSFVSEFAEKPPARDLGRFGIADVDLSKLVGASRSMITKVRLGQANPSLPLAVKISKETGIPVEKLVAAGGVQ